MNIIKPKYEILEQKYDKDNLLEEMFKHIEICGRTCYKSEDKITDTSYERFIKMLEDSNHGAMLEHGTVYLTIPLGTVVDDPQYMWKVDIVRFFQDNKYSVVKEKTINQTVDVEIKGYGMKTQASAHFYFITTNWRVIFENRDKVVCKYALENHHIKRENLKDSILQWMTTPTEDHEKRHSVRFTCDIGVTREYNRHRKDSICEESTRYCNYTKEKFQDGNNGLNIIEPCWFTEHDTYIAHGEQQPLTFLNMCDIIQRELDNKIFEVVHYWLFANYAAEFAYNNLIKLGWKPQQARTVLPLDTKTTLIHTAFDSDWVHFFNLRALGTTGAPHPSAKELAYPVMEEFLKNNWITKEQLENEHEDCDKHIDISKVLSNTTMKQ